MAANGRKPHGSRKIKAEHMLIAAAVVVLGMIAFKMRSKKMASKATTAEVDLPSEGTPLQGLYQAEPTAYDSKAYKAEVAQMRAQFAAKTMLGLESMELKEENGLIRIPSQFIPRMVWCQGGDLDTMKYASKDVGADEFLISLEPNNGGKGDSLRTNLAALYKGIEHTFKVKPRSARSYGLYICSDSKNAASCKDKTLKTHAEIGKEAAQAKDSARKDYIFYYQHVLLDKNNLEVYKSNNTSEEFKKSIENYLRKRKGIDTAEFQTAWKVSNVMRSASPDVRDGRLRLTLPYNDPRCMGSGK